MSFSFFSAEVEKDESTNLGKVFRTHLVLTESFLAAISEIHGETTHITSFIPL
jgi:hypothetical protein